VHELQKNGVSIIDEFEEELIKEGHGSDFASLMAIIESASNMLHLHGTKWHAIDVVGFKVYEAKKKCVQSLFVAGFCNWQNNPFRRR